MKFSKSLVLGAASLALAVGSAWAADKPLDNKNSDGKVSKKEAANASRSDSSGFAKLDKNKDGYISKAEGKGQAELTSNFAKWDMNNDGKINRAEYLAAMAKHDAGKAVDKVAGNDKDKARGASASAGASADKPLDAKNSDGKVSKKEAANASRSDSSGFARLDKNKDGYISQAEGKGQAELTSNFAKWDLNNDGKLNRAEYLAAMAKHDAGRAVDKVTGNDKDKDASRGTTAKPKD